MERNSNEVIIVNLHQVAYYLKHGIEPIRMELSYNDRLTFIYTKEQTKGVWENWIKQHREFVKNKSA